MWDGFSAPRFLSSKIHSVLFIYGLWGYRNRMRNGIPLVHHPIYPKKKVMDSTCLAPIVTQDHDNRDDGVKKECFERYMKTAASTQNNMLSVLILVLISTAHILYTLRIPRICSLFPKKKRQKKPGMSEALLASFRKTSAQKRCSHSGPCLLLSKTNISAFMSSSSNEPRKLF
jgi:hypothetical protein